jgi:hypothetical protein
MSSIIIYDLLQYYVVFVDAVINVLIQKKDKDDPCAQTQARKKYQEEKCAQNQIGNQRRNPEFPVG